MGKLDMDKFFLIHSLNFIKRRQKNEVQWLRIHLPMQQIQTQSLVEELRSTCHGATNPSTATSEPTSSGTTCHNYREACAQQ